MEQEENFQGLCLVVSDVCPDTAVKRYWSISEQVLPIPSCCAPRLEKIVQRQTVLQTSLHKVINQKHLKKCDVDAL